MRPQPLRLGFEDEGAGSTELMGSGNNNGHSGQNGSSSSFAVNGGGLGDTLGSGGGGGGFVLGGVPTPLMKRTKLVMPAGANFRLRLRYLKHFFSNVFL